MQGILQHDAQLSCQWTYSWRRWSCTSPKARFTTQFFVARVVGDDKHHILDATYTVRNSTVACGSFATYRGELCSFFACATRPPEQVRKADGTSETSDILNKDQLVELLESVFGLTLPMEVDGIDRFLAPAAATL